MRKVSMNLKKVISKIKDRLSSLTFTEKLGSIKVKLAIGLLIPILFLAVYGIVSYKISEDAIIGNYEVSASDTISAVNKYMNMGLNMAERSSMELTLDINFKEFFDLSYENAKASIKSYDDIQDRINISAMSNYFVSDIHIISANGISISTNSNVNEELYQSIVDSDIGTAFKKGPQVLWMGSHKDLDSIMLRNDMVYNTDAYAISVIRKFANSRGYVIIDISADRIRDMFSEYDMGEGSIMGFITEDGKETLSNTDSNELFTGLDYYQKIFEMEEDHGYSYEKYKGEDYLFIYSKLNNIPGTICSLIPKSTILKEVSGVKALSFAFVSIAVIIALAIVLLITKGITDAIKKMNQSISKAAEGDLTVEFDKDRKDEFKLLAMGISNMIDHMSNLIGDVQGVSGTVSNSAKNLSGTSGELLEATKGISLTIDDIGGGIIQQAEDAENCLNQMSGLADQINQLYENTNENEKIANETKSVTTDGIQIIEELNDKAKATTEITQDVINKIQELGTQSKKIGSFVDIINEIASQTNLLSLNASIEAARAGEAGRGFAVVAEEIRKLADQTIDASNQIQQTVKEIALQNEETITTAEQAEDIVASQTDALNNTTKVFDNISHHVNDLAENFKGILIRLKNIEEVKDDTLKSIQNISAVTEETAAASQEMNATAQLQNEAVEQLRKSAIILEKDARKLEDAIKIFKISDN